jgi:hypothetical protein
MGHPLIHESMYDALHSDGVAKFRQGLPFSNALRFWCHSVCSSLYQKHSFIKSLCQIVRCQRALRW